MSEQQSNLIRLQVTPQIHLSDLIMRPGLNSQWYGRGSESNRRFLIESEQKFTAWLLNGASTRQCPEIQHCTQIRSGENRKTAILRHGWRIRTKPVRLIVNLW